MSTKTTNGSNGTTAKTATKGGNSVTNGTAVKTEVPVAKVEAKPTPEQLAKARYAKFTKLQSFHEDIAKLEVLQKNFDSIRQFGDIQVIITCDGQQAFSTSRTDTVEAVLSATEQSISKKLELAYQALAEFQF